MDFSLFDEASRDYDAEAYERRTALVRTAVQHEAMPFLALASTEAEYSHRKALMEKRLEVIAARCRASVAEVEATADRMFGLLGLSHQRAAEAARQVHAAMKCANCDHGSVDHSEGLQCSACGCNDFTPQAKTAAKTGLRHPADPEKVADFLLTNPGSGLHPDTDPTYVRKVRAAMERKEARQVTADQEGSGPFS